MDLALFKTHPSLMATLEMMYAEGHRKYHTWEHIEALVEVYEMFADQITHPEQVLYALYFHDAVYEIPGPENEQKSAELFRKTAKGVLDQEIIDDVFALIVATKAHSLPSDIKPHLINDCALFLDMDMSILGAPESAYERYSAQIREEYKSIPDQLYQAGRKSILTGFLEREAIFLTPDFNQRFEAAALRNIAAEIERL